MARLDARTPHLREPLCHLRQPSDAVDFYRRYGAPIEPESRRKHKFAGHGQTVAQQTGLKAGRVRRAWDGKRGIR